MVAVRVGAAVAVYWGGPGATEIDKDAREATPRLCLYDPDCRPRTGLPASLEPLRNGGEAWIAVLQAFAETDPDARPGESIAAAAELGYRPTIVPVGCDEDAELASGLGDSTRYVAVYFPREADAKAFAAALPELDVRTHAVRTYCT